MYCHSLSSRSAGSNPPASWLRQPAAEPYRRLIFKPQARCPARSSKVGHGLRTYRPVRKLSHEGPSFWRCFSGAFLLATQHSLFQVVWLMAQTKQETCSETSGSAGTTKSPGGAETTLLRVTGRERSRRRPRKSETPGRRDNEASHGARSAAGGLR
jgi:hypothetical protein